ncbi:hypothetical protein [Pseudomonas sp.]|nr:hypothetical protein [Pseudomonas sp.]
MPLAHPGLTQAVPDTLAGRCETNLTEPFGEMIGNDVLHERKDG